MSTNPSRNATLMMVAAALVVVWGIVGTMGAGDTPYLGYFTDGNNTVTQVLDDGPAQMAGLQTGDIITSIGGIAVTDSRALNDRGRPAIGEIQAITVDRGGQNATVDIEYAAQPGTQALLGHLASLMALSFVLFGLWAHRKTPNATTSSLAWFGICFSALFMTAPYFASPMVRTMTGLVFTIAIVAGFALLLDFLMQTGSDEAFTDQKTTPRWIFWPAIAVGVVMATITIIQPAATSTMNVVLRSMIGLFVVGYFGGSLVQVVRNYMKADAARRESRKMGKMMMGAAVGLGPLTLGLVINLVSPATVIPTLQYWFLALTAIPITFALAAVHGSEAAMATQTAGAAPAADSAPAAPPAAEPEAPAPPPTTDPMRTMSVGGPDKLMDEGSPSAEESSSSDDSSTGE